MVKPNIILILSESYADLSVLGAVETSSDYMSYYNSLTENVIKGNLYTSVLGGLTANSEFEILTGDTMAFLPTGSVAFTQQVKREMSTIASTLSSKGYDIVAIHPQPANNWKRNAVYPLLGINHFIDQKAFEGGEYVRSYISDEYLFQKMIEVFEKKEEEPLFLYAITMQNHGGYGLEGNETVTITNMTDVESAAKFVDLMNITDQALPTLIDYFSEYEEPTIICMYGDHQPALTDSFYNQAYALSGITSEEEKITRKYITPFMIWANYDIEEKEIEAMSANYLGAYLLEVAGLELPSYYQYLLNMYQTLPVISAIQLQDAEGTIYLNGQDHPYTEIIKNYQILQYYHLFDS